MCFGCYQNAGCPRIINEKVLAVLPLIERVYEFSIGGGNLHCELDDWNLEDEHFEKPEMQIFLNENSPEQIAAERECWAALKAMTEGERYSAVAIHDGFLTENGELSEWAKEALQT